MARLVSLTTLQNRVLQRANLESGGNAAIYSASELLDDINEGIAEWYEYFCQVDQGGYYLNSTTFSTTLASDTYAIGPGQIVNVTDFYKAKGVDVQFGQNLINTARPFNWNERNRFKIIGAWIYTQPIFYSLVGKTSALANAANDAIKFIPTPTGSYQVTLWYFPTPPVLANPTDAIDGMNGSEEIAVLSAAIKLLEKQEQFEHSGMLSGKLAEAKQKLLEDLTTRDAENPPRVADVNVTDTWIYGSAY